MDLGAIIQAPMQDKEWLKKCALMGLLTIVLCIVPIAGGIIAGLNAAGWLRTYADSRLRGETDLPPAGLGYMGPGWRLFLSYLPLIGVMIAVEIVTVVLTMIGASAHVPALAMIGSVVGVVLLLPLSLWNMVMMPGMLFLHIVKGEPWSSMQIGKLWRLMMAGGTEYLLFWVAILVAGIISELGIIACGVGLIVSIPYGMAMYGASIAEFERAARDRIPA